MIGIFFLTCAWLGFLALDGFDLTKGLSQKTHTETPAPGNHLQLKNLIRMPAESSRELDTEERNAVKLGANLIAGCCFLLLYTVA